MRIDIQALIHEKCQSFSFSRPKIDSELPRVAKIPAISLVRFRVAEMQLKTAIALQFDALYIPHPGSLHTVDGDT